MSTRKNIESLLYEEEDGSLDFKSEQYLFVGASDDQKSELLKDILAFANAWRRTAASIVIGVAEVKGGKSKVVGITEDIDDAQLQQFVNKKVNRPIDFSYQTSEIDGLKVALIVIPQQSRPFYLKKKFGKLTPSTVYIRRGSSTDTASPDEISEMGTSERKEMSDKPVLSTFIASGEHNEKRSSAHSDSIIIAKIPPLSAFPEYSSRKKGQLSSFSILEHSLNQDNSKYFSELAKFTQQVKCTSFLKFGIENIGSKVARDVRAQFEFDQLPQGTRLKHSRYLLTQPSQHKDSFGIMSGNLWSPVIYDMDVSDSASGQTVDINFGKVQAKDSKICNEVLCIHGSESFKSKVKVTVFSDDLSEPSSSELLIEITAENVEYSVQDFLR